MNFDYLNEMINYIEENLTEEIDYKQLAKIVGVSEYSLQRIFMFLTNTSLSEYIRKRKLSKAFEELKSSNIKIIDLAIKYGYESSISFSRAFKNMFKITPSECRNTSKEYKQFPIITFKNTNQVCEELNYKIKELGDTIIYCKRTCAKTHEDLLFNIRKLYKEIEENGLHKKFDESKMYGIYMYKDDTYYYYVGCQKEFKNTDKFIIPKGKYAIFNVGSRKQKDITNTDKKIYSQWLPSTNYEINWKKNKQFNIEVYVDNNCYIYMPIKAKEN